MTIDAQIRSLLNEVENRLSLMLQKQVSVVVGADAPETSPTYILHSVCAVLRVSATAVLGRSRRSQLVDARFLTQWYLHSKYGMTKSHIAAFMNVDHTSTIHGINTVNNRIHIKDERTLIAIESINKYLNLTNQ